MVYGSVLSIWNTLLSEMDLVPDFIEFMNQMERDRLTKALK